MANILVTGAGGAPAFNFCQSLRASGRTFHLTGIDCDRYHLALAATDEAYLVPPASDPDYLDALNRIIAEREIDLLFAQPDAEVAVISEARDRLNTAVCLPSRDTVTTCQDKFRTFELWQAAGIPQPLTRLVKDRDDLEALFSRFETVWLRPLKGAAGRGALHARGRADAEAWLTLNEGWGCYTGAEYLSPQSVTWQSLWDDGRLLVAQGRRRLYWEYSDRTLSGVTGITGGAVTVRDPVVDDIALRAIRAIDSRPHGIFSVDLTYDRSGVPNPTEINIGRFFTTQLFFTRAGLNMPLLLVELALHGLHPEGRLPILNPLPAGLVWLRRMDGEPVLTNLEAIDALEQAPKHRRPHSKRQKLPA